MTKKKKKQKTNKRYNKTCEKRERENFSFSVSCERTHTHAPISLPLSHPPPLSHTHTHDSPVVTILSYNDDDDANLFASSSRLSFPPSHPSPTHCLTPSLPPSPNNTISIHHLPSGSPMHVLHTGVGAASAVAPVPGIRPRASDARTSPIRPSAAAAPLAEA